MSERRSLQVIGETRSALAKVADELLEAYLDPHAAEMQHIGSYELPSEAGVERVVDISRELLFPGYAGPDVPRMDRRELGALVQLRLEELHATLHRQVYRAAHHKR